MSTVCLYLAESIHGLFLLIILYQCRPTDTESHPRTGPLIVMTANDMHNNFSFGKDLYSPIYVELCSHQRKPALPTSEALSDRQLIFAVDYIWRLS